MPSQALVLTILVLHLLPVAHMVTTRAERNNMIARGEIGRDLSPGRVGTAATGSAACSEFAARLRTPVRSRGVASRSASTTGKSPRRHEAAAATKGGEGGKMQFDDTEAAYVEHVVAKSAQRMAQQPRAPPPKPQSPLWATPPKPQSPLWNSSDGKDGRTVKRSSSANIVRATPVKADLRVLISPPATETAMRAEIAQPPRAPFTMIAPPAPVSMGAERGEAPGEPAAAPEPPPRRPTRGRPSKASKEQEARDAKAVPAGHASPGAQMLDAAYPLRSRAAAPAPAARRGAPPRQAKAVISKPQTFNPQPSTLNPKP